MDKCGVQTNKSTLEKDQGSYLELLFTMTKHKDKFCHHNYAREVPKTLFFSVIDSVLQRPPPPPPPHHHERSSTQGNELRIITENYWHHN